MIKRIAASKSHCTMSYSAHGYVMLFCSWVTSELPQFIFTTEYKRSLLQIASTTDTNTLSSSLFYLSLQTNPAVALKPLKIVTLALC